MVGVEPTRQSPVLKHFECSLLRPLEYICIFNFVARNFPQGVISSQSRYDHFDTSAYSVLLRGRSGTVQLVPIGCTAYYNSSRKECQFSAGGNSRVHSRWGGGLWHGAGNTAVQKVCRILHNLPQNLYISQGVRCFEGVICLRVDGYR